MKNNAILCGRKENKQKAISLNMFKIFLLVFLYILGVFAFASHINIVRKKNYEKTVEYVKKGNYILAAEGFEDLHHIFYEKFSDDVLNGKDYDKYYKDSAVLYAYSQALVEYKRDNSGDAAVWVKALPDGYKGIMHEEITEFKKKFTDHS